MRPSRSTAVAAVVASAVALLVSRGHWTWGQTPPPAAAVPASAPPAAAIPAAATAPAAAQAQPAPQPPPQPAAQPAPQPAPQPPPAPAAQSAAHAEPGLPSGTNVTVYLRADATGIQFTGANMEFRNLASRKGAFVRSDNDWFVIKNESQEIWVPRTSIALVEMR